MILKLFHTWVALVLSISSCNAACLNNIPDSAPDNRYKIISEGSEVIDLKTGLKWQRCSVGQTWDGASCIGDLSQLTWKEALTTANQKSSTTKKFRVPNIRELLSLRSTSCYGPSINYNIFPQTSRTDYYWSSSPSIFRSEYVRIMSIYDGSVYDGGWFGYGQVGRSTSGNYLRLLIVN